MRKKIARAAYFLFFFFGIAVIYFLGKEFGWQNIWTLISNIALTDLGIILLLPLVWIFFHSLGWHFLLDRRHDFTFLHMLGAQISSMAISELPMGQAGGEPYRIYYLRKHFGTQESPNIIASVILYNTIHSLVTGALFVTGFLAILFLVRVNPYKIALVIAALLIGGITVLVFIQKQKKGIMGKIFDLLEKISFLRKFAHRKREKALQVDERLVSFYIQHRTHFFISFFFILIAKAMGAVEFYLIMGFIGFPVTFMVAFIVFAGSAVVQLLLFFLPLGPTEGAIIFLFKALGQNPAAATALALFRRVRVIFWTLIGFVIAHFWGPKPGKTMSHENDL